MFSKLSILVVITLLAAADTADEEHLVCSCRNESQSNHTAETTAAASCIQRDLNCDSNCDQSLEQVAMNIKNENCSKVYVSITGSELQLRTRVTFSQLEFMYLTTHPDYSTAATIKCSVVNTGIVFDKISNLTLHNLKMTRCGLTVTAVGLWKAKFISALTIMKGTYVNIDNITVQDSIGIGLALLNHQAGQIQIKASNYLGNAQCNSSTCGGLYVGGFEEGSHYKPMTFLFEDCTFERNVAHTNRADVKQKVSGGGATIALNGGLTKVDAVFSRCTFVDNEALSGGGLAVTIESKLTGEVSVSVDNSYFEENGCHSAANGGGMYVSTDTNSNGKSQFIIRNVTFSRNCATFGGGLHLRMSRDTSTEISNRVEIDQCKFEENSAHKGSAVAIAPGSVQHFMDCLFMTSIIFRNCIFLKNTVTVTNRTYTMLYGIGTLYIDQCSIVLEGNNNFQENFGTGIHTINGVVDMSQSDATFIDNIGYQGGAMALIGESSVIVGPSRMYKFSNNTALDRGGALYVKQISNHDISVIDACFLQCHRAQECIHTDELNTTLYFKGNSAKTGIGHVLFATSLRPCQPSTLKNDGKIEYINISDVFWSKGIIIEGDQMLHGQQVSTEDVLFLYDNRFYDVIPGKTFAPNVTIKDESGNQAMSVLTAVRVHNSRVNIDQIFLSDNKIVIKGKPGEVAIIQLHTMTSRVSFTELTVRLTDCPVGFLYSETSLECECNHKRYVGIMNCNTSTFRTSLLYGYWAGMLQNSRNNNTPELVTSYCPLNFCSYNKTYIQQSTVVLPQLSIQLDRAMCGETRTGTVCGKCAEGYTTHFHSPNFICYPVNKSLCKVGWLFYILSELVPVTVVFITVIVFNISFTSGAVNGFILFSQLLNSLYIDVVEHSHVPLPVTLTVLREGYRFVYRILSLNFFQIEKLSFCLWPQASAIDMLAFKYVTVVYALVLVVLVICFMNKCGGRCLGKWCRITTVKSSIIHGISAFLILCYSQCVKISLELINSFPLHTKKGSNLKLSRRVWLNGNIDNFSDEHLPYALPALFCLLTIGVFPPLLLLAYPLLNKVLSLFGLEESKIVNKLSQKIRISSLKPLLDSFQGCFKDNMRFFAGLYFLYRWIAPLLAVVPLSGYSRVYTAMESIIIFILVMHTVCQPYSKRCHNTIDTLLFANLALINAFTFMCYHTVHDKLDVNTMDMKFIIVAVILELVLTYLPLAVVLAYMLVRLCRSIPCGQNRNSVPLINLARLLNGKDQAEDEEYVHSPIANGIHYLHF